MAKKKSSQGTNRRAARREEKHRARRRNQIVQSVAVLALIGVVAAFALWPRAAAPAADSQRVRLDPVLGAEGAPVTITEFADFGCPSCRAWHRAGIRESIMAAYGERVRFVWKDFPVITPFSPKAAEAGQCALDQGQESFWAFHDLVYQHGRLRVDDLKAYAAELELDTAVFDRCLDAGRHEATVRSDLEEARALRLRGTPSFLIGDRVLPGPPGYDQLAALIDAALTN